jgi:hypothetical protein
MTSPLRVALEIVQAIIAQAVPFGPRTSVVFDEPAPTVPVDQLLSFIDLLPEPTMRRCCTIGWQSSMNIFPDISATKPMGLVATRQIRRRLPLRIRSPRQDSARISR